MESKSSQVVATDLSLTCGDEEASLRGGLRYDPADALAVSLRLGRDSQEVVWTFARDLLAEGAYAPTGDGDVHIWPCLNSRGEAIVIVELVSPDGELLVEAPMREVRAFLEESERAVPRGTEHVDVDSCLARIFA